MRNVILAPSFNGVSKIFEYFKRELSANDHIVPYESLIAFPHALQAKAIQIPGIGHMGSKSGLEEFPEVIRMVETL